MSVERIGPKWMEIDLLTYENNLRTLRDLVHPAEVIPSLKADAYGHGLLPLARACERVGLSTVAVATLDEAKLLRKAFLKCNILLLGAQPESSINDILNHRITPTVCTAEFAKEMSDRSRSLGLKTHAHVYVDTGMGRMGQKPDLLKAWFSDAQNLPGLHIDALYSHYAVADEISEEAKTYSKNQWQSLKELGKELGISNLHMANSAGLLAFPDSHAQAVRPGLLSYGISPFEGEDHPKGIRPVLSLRCRAQIVKAMTKGDTVSYGRTFAMPEDGFIATLPVGYGDGIPRNLASHLKVEVEGRRVPVVGRICMDMTMVHLGKDPVAHDAIFTLLGGRGPSMEDWAKGSERIPYEIVTGLGRRWTRCYLRNEKLEELVKPS